MPLRLVPSLRAFLSREDGPTAVEYAVMLALIVVVCMSGVSAVGGSAGTIFLIAGSAAEPPPQPGLYASPNGQQYNSETGELTGVGGTTNVGTNNRGFMSGGWTKQ